jgi:hypothetical protein
MQAMRFVGLCEACIRGNREGMACDFVCEGVICSRGFGGDTEIAISTFIQQNIILNQLPKAHIRPSKVCCPRPYVNQQQYPVKCVAQGSTQTNNNTQ